MSLALSLSLSAMEVPLPPPSASDVVVEFRSVAISIDKLDDPVMWGFKGFPITDAKSGRWVLAAEDICFKNTVLSYLFRLEDQRRTLMRRRAKQQEQEALLLLKLSDI